MVILCSSRSSNWSLIILLLFCAEEEEEKQFEEEWKKEQIDTREVRGTWKHSLDFLFSCISVSVGLGSKKNTLHKFHINSKYMYKYNILLYIRSELFTIVV